ncbi:hypothetical protein FNV43_RR16383 [Rhamnella rubrinervis]|uniref:Homeobox-leucine zipper protein n=1 Tax=Rhamnella rubrinervis TaxID=2594499 RepID=A0A8K0GYP1_9ROSA|nr:hypothetical protein FNV43_RR16383 [Rhamnella rubrinervis]
MDSFQTTQNHKHYKKRLTHEQVKLLERSFTSNTKLHPERKLQLAVQLGIPPRQVAIWYQNKRARSRTQSLELDYGELQLKLENALAEKRQLEKDVERLKGELGKAQEMLFALDLTSGSTRTSSSANRPVVSSSIISSNDQEGLSSRSSPTFLYEDCVNDDAQVLQFDQELYACLIGSDGLITWD